MNQWIRVGQKYINMDNVTHVVDLVDPPELQIHTTVAEGHGDEPWGPNIIFLHDGARRAMLEWLRNQCEDVLRGSEPS